MKTKKDVTLETFITLAVLGLFFFLMGREMGLSNFFSTMMNTAHDLLLNTVFYILAIAVIAGALGSLMTEFGIVALINRIISPVMRPIYRLPGAAALCIVTTFLSDNPAVIGLANDPGFKKYFSKSEIPCLCNLGTAYGMGLIVWTFMASLSEDLIFFKAASIGILGAVVGSIVSVRLMRIFTNRAYGEEEDQAGDATITTREVREGSAGQRALDALLEGGKNGVDMGMSIIPGVLIICTLVMMLTNQMPEAGYSGAAYEGVGFLPKVGQFLMPVLQPVFGFSSPEAIAFPLTALGAVGAALGMVPTMLQGGLVGPHDIAVFTAMGMCFSGYLSTHIAMMDALNTRFLTSKAIFSHTIGGIVAGVAANLLFRLFLG